MPSQPPKSPFRCPVCGFVQLEPPHLVSTNCRSCGAHYEASAEGVRAAGASELPNFIGKKQEATRPVHCLKCGRTHMVSQKAQSTICPGCYAPIELIEVSINASASRAVDTRGHLKIGPKGILSSNWIVCGSARVEGTFHGHMRCEGEARLALQKPSPGRISAGHLVVEKKSRAEFRQPVEGDAITVEGELNADVRCSGIVRVLKNGRLEGRIETTSLVVEKGGVLHGPCVIRPPAKPAPVEEPPQIEAGTETQEAAETVTEDSSEPAASSQSNDAPATDGDAARPN
ncbi:MAG: polymer-forming cytoskeletal protein [Verrucomicrobia bacterium]|nr:polymer-forming cytoskeletal protein [Verrucomicrobiota bacterium]